MVLAACAGAVSVALTVGAGGAAGYFSGVVPGAGLAGDAAVVWLAHVGAGDLGGRGGDAIYVDCCEEGAGSLLEWEAGESWGCGGCVPHLLGGEEGGTMEEEGYKVQ